MILLVVFITSCHVSEYLKIGPVTAHKTTIVNRSNKSKNAACHFCNSFRKTIEKFGKFTLLLFSWIFFLIYIFTFHFLIFKQTATNPLLKYNARKISRFWMRSFWWLLIKRFDFKKVLGKTSVKKHTTKKWQLILISLYFKKDFIFHELFSLLHWCFPRYSLVVSLRFLFVLQANEFGSLFPFLWCSINVHKTFAWLPVLRL